MKGLTEKQSDIFDYLVECIRDEHYTPTVREIADRFGIKSTNAVRNHLEALERKGYLSRKPGASRGIELADEHFGEPGGVPIIGRVTAGLPMYAQQEWDGSIVLDATVYRGQNLFALRIDGDSMKDVGILDNDLAICEPRQYARNGEIVVALIHGEEATVKRFYLHKDHIELRPENPRYKSVHYGFGDVLIQGRLVGIQRSPCI